MTAGYTLRPYQQDAVDEIVADFESGAETVLLDAPVGSGKTIIATEVALRLGVPDMAYLPPTKDLQAQYDGEFGARGNKRPDTAALINGHANYCDEPLLCAGTCSVCGKSGKTVGHVMLVHHATMAEAVEMLVGTCPYWYAKARASEHWGVNTNPWYFVLEGNSIGTFADRDLAIYDEADMLDGVIDSISGLTVTEDSLLWYTKYAPIERERESLRELAIRWLEDAADRAESQSKRILDEVRRARAEADAAKFTRVATMLRLGRDQVSMTWADDRIKADYVRMDRRAASLLWPLSSRRLIMSGSFGNMAAWERYMGIEATHVVRVAHPIPVERRLIRRDFVADMGRGGYGDDAKVDAMARRITRIRNGRTLVHVTSGKQAEALAARLDDAIVYGSGDAAGRAEAVSEFKNREDALLIGQSLHRGLDLHGDLCRTNIIAKAPWQALSDLANARRRVYGSSWYPMVSAAEMVQATGRAVRGPDDWADTYLLDAGCAGLLSHTPHWFREAVA